VNDQPTRRTLLLKIRDAGDSDAWGEFVELYMPLVFGFCRKRGLSDVDASDVTQEVLRAIARAIGKFEYDPGKGTFRSWFFTVVRSKLYNFSNKQQRQPHVRGGTTMMQLVNETPDPTEEQDWDLDYRRQVFQWASERIRGKFSEPAWKSFWMTAVEDRDPAETAASLGLTRGAVYAAKARVIAALKEEITSVAGEGDFDVI
jgi:RNA polymerase sigma-70 factor (ECF subfamily)